MHDLVRAFPSHLREGMEISSKADLGKPVKGIEGVLVIGMGGSGIGGSIAAQLLSNELKVPVSVCKDYHIPSFVSDRTLVIASSYSGNTEETLNALGEAEGVSAKIFCISSGGELASIAEKNKYPIIRIPAGIPPRAAFGYSFPQLFRILQFNEQITWNVNELFRGCISLLESEQMEIMDKAMSMAEKLKDRDAVIYSESRFEGVCIRFRQQINENSKKLCWHHVLPEMNHNELVGWRLNQPNASVIMIRSESDDVRNQKRMELTKKIISNYCPSVHEMHSRGKNDLERTLYLIHFCDWVSVMVAELNGTDAMEVKVIDYLKGELGKNA